MTDALNKDFDERFHKFSQNKISFDSQKEQYNVDENNDGETDYSFDKPDFNFVQFRSNLVFHWEYVPGSALFLVWSQGVSPDAYGDLNTPPGQSLFDNIFDTKAHNIFLVKFT